MENNSITVTEYPTHTGGGLTTIFVAVCIFSTIAFLSVKIAEYILNFLGQLIFDVPFSFGFIVSFVVSVGLGTYFGLRRITSIGPTEMAAVKSRLSNTFVYNLTSTYHFSWFGLYPIEVIKNATYNPMEAVLRSVITHDGNELEEVSFINDIQLVDLCRFLDYGEDDALSLFLREFNDLGETIVKFSTSDNLEKKSGLRFNNIVEELELDLSKEDFDEKLIQSADTLTIIGCIHRDKLDITGVKFTEAYKKASEMKSNIIMEQEARIAEDIQLSYRNNRSFVSRLVMYTNEGSQKRFKESIIKKYFQDDPDGYDVHELYELMAAEIIKLAKNGKLEINTKKEQDEIFEAIEAREGHISKSVVRGLEGSKVLPTYNVQNNKKNK